jgi:ferrous iron transport protein B
VILAAPALDLVTVALAGNPNSGKTTLFNALTGLRQKVANYPGVTVERKTGRCRLADGRSAEIIDLPGTYSLVATSPDEQVAMEVLRGLRADTALPQVVVAVVDASNLARNLYLVSHLLGLGRPVVVVLTMDDIAQGRGEQIDRQILALRLGVPVVRYCGRTGDGLDGLRAVLAEVVAAPQPPVFSLPVPMATEVDGLSALIAGEPDRRRNAALRLLTGDEAQDLAAARQATGEQVGLSRERLRGHGIEAMEAEIEARYAWIDGVVAASLVRARPATRSLTERVDAVLVHKVFGLVLFAAVMGALFLALFVIADPVMGWIDDGFAWLGALVAGSMAEGPLRSLITDGLIAGVGGVVIFVPQIALLFAFLAVLEDSGYLARAAFLMDRLLASVGLHGRSFIPLLSSFACAIPGIMATRTIASPRERLATILVAPFMSCAARLPVYGLLIGAFFVTWSPLGKAGILLACYLLGIAAAAAVAFVATRLLGRRGQVTPFILEMPTYQVPQLGAVLRAVWFNSWAFVRRAGTIIVAITVLLWALAYYPQLPAERVAEVRAAVAAVQPAEATEEERAAAVDQAESGARLAHSAAGVIGKVIEPVIAPLGFDWKMGVGLVGAFAAREVFVSTLGVVYGVGEVGDDDSSLQQAMLADRRTDGKPVWGTAVAISLLVWFVLAMQCMSTVAIVRRETGGWTWPIAQLVGMNAIAWIGSFIAYRAALLVWP